MVLGMGLIALSCQKQSEVVLYTSVDEPYIRQLIKRFEIANGVKVVLVTDSEGAKTTGLAERVLAERERPRCDVYWGNEPFHTVRLAEAGVLQAYNSPNAAEIPRQFHGLRFLHPENGVDPVRFPIAEQWAEPSGRFRFVTVGRLVPYKGLSLTLEAIRRSARLRECELIVIGDGPDRQRHEQFVAEHGLQNCVSIRGQLPQAELAAEMRRSQAFVFPSLREFGGGVILEAMACALPSLIVDYGGPAELVSDATGIKLPMRPREELIESLRIAMEDLAANPLRCKAMGEAAANEVRREHLWDAKASKMVAYYSEVIQTNPLPLR